MLIRENSTGNLCRQGRGWGFDNSGIWVDRGCRAQFSFGRDDGGGGGNWGRSGEITLRQQRLSLSATATPTRKGASASCARSRPATCAGQGRGWGFDNNGIWVDRGCRGDFRYGREQRQQWRERNDDAAIAAGIIGAFAVGAAIGSSQQQAAPPPPPPPPPPPTSSATRPPAWAIGSFQAYDPDSGDIVQLVVDGGGQVYLRNEIGEVVNQGDLRDGTILWSERQAILARARRARACSWATSIPASTSIFRRNA